MISLSELKAGESGWVVRIGGEEDARQEDGNGRLLKLSALGLIPGSLIRLQQKFPAYIVWIGQTQLSLDEAVAKEIYVEKK